MSTTENRKNVKKQVWYWVQGNFLDGWFRGKSLRWLIAGALLAFFMVYNNYTALRKLRKMNDLKRELTELRLEHVSISSTLMGATRISAIEKRVQDEQIDISIPKTPPVIVKK